MIGLLNLIAYPSYSLPTPDQGNAPQNSGHFKQAIANYQATLNDPHLDLSSRIDIYLQLAQTYQYLGFTQEAIKLLTEQALPLVDNAPLQQALIYGSLTDLFLASRQDTKARDYADKSMHNLPTTAPNRIRASLLNNLGNVLTVEAYYPQAIQHYAQAIELAEQDPILIATALINMAQAYFKNKQTARAIESLLSAVEALRKNQSNLSSDFPSENNLDSPNYRQTLTWLSIGSLAQRFAETPCPNPKTCPKTTPTLHALSLEALNQALDLAKTLNNARLLSYSYGYLGHLYELQKKYSDSLQATRQALFFAQQDKSTFFTQQNQASEILYRWEWQLGRLLQTTNHPEEAISAYRKAVNSLQPVRSELAIGYRNSSQSFREAIGPVYYELADLLLQKAVTDQKHKIQWLKEAQHTIENLKTAELQDYFKDDCITTDFQTTQNSLDTQIQPHTAILYPVLLPDRLELLLNLATDIQQFNLPITAEQLKDQINEFRFELQTHHTQDYLDYAQRLYRWLIAPLETTLAKHHIHTLIFVPDGVLRTVPLAALHDEQQFLIERYAIAITPGLTLTTKSSTVEEKVDDILIGALSMAIEGYPELLNVSNEVHSLQQLYGPHATLLMDQAFTVHNFKQVLEKNSFSIIHLASHGQFDSDPQKTFILTQQGKLTMGDFRKTILLGKLRNEPLDLITLSACQTAVGDEQAALGLAGVAIKAGALSALASLWFIEDRSTSLLMNDFYRSLKMEKLSKVKSLQNAQQLLLKRKEYQHPAFWSPFLLIGNWH